VIFAKFGVKSKNEPFYNCPEDFHVVA